MLTRNHILYCIAVISYSIASIYAFPPAKETYNWLNQDPKTPFVVSFGTSMSQTAPDCKNTCHVAWISSQLQKLAQSTDNPYNYLRDPERIWYVLKSIPSFTCHTCNTTIYPDQLNLKHNAAVIKAILIDVASQKHASNLTITQCPTCHTSVTQHALKVPVFSEAHQAALVAQVDHIGVKGQKACKQHLPPYRLSLEAADVLKNNSTEIDPEKLQKQASFLEKLGNPFTFFHHYSNPQVLANFPEKPEDAAWFGNYCAQIITATPGLTHVCPISQPTAFSMRVARTHNLPPFTSSLPQPEHFNKVVEAHIAAYNAIKQVSPQTKVYVSHQWKPMIPAHNDLRDPRFYLEKTVCTIASRIYNESFVNKFRQHQDKFDGLAISVYPPIKFNLWRPEGNNSSGVIDEKYSLECIMKMHEAFPNKPIMIVETGCNHPNPEVRKQFMDMTLNICKQARLQGVNIQGIYFWNHTDDSEFYREWNTQAGTSDFGFYDRLDPQNPIASINPAGRYLKEIVSND